MGTAMRIDGVDGFLEVVDQFDGALQATVLIAKAGSTGDWHGQVAHHPRPGMEHHLTQKGQQQANNWMLASTFHFL